MGYYNNNGWGGGWGPMLIGMTLMLLFWVAVIFVVVYAIRTFGHDNRTRHGSDAAEDRAIATLRERYARGEIDHAEYEERHRKLTTEMPQRR